MPLTREEKEAAIDAVTLKTSELVTVINENIDLMGGDAAALAAHWRDMLERSFVQQITRLKTFPAPPNGPTPQP